MLKKINHRLKRAETKSAKQRRNKKRAEIQFFVGNQSNQQHFYQLFYQAVIHKKFAEKPAQISFSRKKLLRNKAHKIKLKKCNRQNGKKTKKAGEKFRGKLHLEQKSKQKKAKNKRNKIQNQGKINIHTIRINHKVDFFNKTDIVKICRKTEQLF